jgi:formate dehydrogenase gamma subunit
MTDMRSSETVTRFSTLDRLLHLVVMLGFTGLALTGLSLGFSATAPARAFVWLVGGAAHAGWLHRFFAVITYACVVAHGLWFLYYKLMLGGRLTGPHSVAPSVKDLKDFRENMAYLLGRKGAPPAFDRFTYLEKIDYWAIFIGMNTMGLTGLVLWYPEAFTRYLPGFFVNIAQVLHLFEAVAAVAVKFFVHIGMAHFRPAVYPADPSIFTGRTTRERMRTEHPGEFRRMADARPAEAGENTEVS